MGCKISITVTKKRVAVSNLSKLRNKITCPLNFLNLWAPQPLPRPTHLLPTLLTDSIASSFPHFFSRKQNFHGPAIMVLKISAKKLHQHKERKARQNIRK